MTKLVLISGPCVIESRQLCLDIAGTMKGIAESLGFKYFFKASFDKANRTSEQSFRGPGLDEGLHILADVREQIGVPVLTDVHTVEQVKPVAEVVDMLQTPAFLCRQTDFVHACAQSGKPVNFKKGQFLSPYDMKNVIAVKALLPAANANSFRFWREQPRLSALPASSLRRTPIPSTPKATARTWCRSRG